jgi:hypothetical protein
MNFTHPYYPRDNTFGKGDTPPAPIPIPPVTNSNADAAIAARQLKERRKAAYGLADTLLAGGDEGMGNKTLLG